MKKKKFPLIALLKYRKSLEQEARKIYTEKQNQLNNILNNITKSFDDVKNSKQSIFAMEQEPGNCNAEKINVTHNFISGLKIKINKLKSDAKEKMKEVDESHKKYLEAMMAYKMIEKLEEKFIKEYKTEIKKYENKKIEELYNILYKRPS